MKEEVAGFADASAPSNSSYQTTLSPTKTSEKPRNMKKKTVREAYAINELRNICPTCNNTGVERKFGNNILCTTCGGDERSARPTVIYQQAQDMLATGKTAAVREDKINELSKKTLGRYIQGASRDRADNSLHQGVHMATKHGEEGRKLDYNHAMKDNKRAHGIRKAVKKLTKEEVITSLDQIKPILESYKPSDKLASRTKYLVQPNLSKKLQDRLAARGPKKTGYQPSASTLGLAAARKAQMSKPKDPTIREAFKKKRLSASTPGKEESELSAKHETQLREGWGAAGQARAREESTKKWNDMFAKHAHDPVMTKHLKDHHVRNYKADYAEPLAKKAADKEKSVKNEEFVFEGNIPRVHSFSEFKREAEDWASHNTHHGNPSYEHRQHSTGGGTLHQTLSIGHGGKSGNPYIIGIFNHKGHGSEEGHGTHHSHNQGLHNEEREFLVDGKKDSKLKRKYRGKMRGTTDTGKPAHAIEIDPVLKTGGEINKVVK